LTFCVAVVVVGFFSFLQALEVAVFNWQQACAHLSHRQRPAPTPCYPHPPYPPAMWQLPYRRGEGRIDGPGGRGRLGGGSPITPCLIKCAARC
jgi:hypothetical protein